MVGRGSAPRCREALAVLDALHVFKTLFECTPELGPVPLRPSALARERPFPTFQSGYSRESSGLASRPRIAIHVETAGEPPYANHLLVGKVESREVEPVLAERPSSSATVHLSTVTRVTPRTRACTNASAF
jgi:hypothetical protein